jgi:L-lactate dehydrogenase complex protein LldG
MSNNANKQIILSNIRRGVNNPELMVDRKRKLTTFEPAPFEPHTLVARWREELEALTGVVYGPLPPAAAVEQLIELAARLEPKAAIVWDDDDLPLPGVRSRLQAAGITVEQIDNSATDPAVRQRLGKIPVGITGAIAGLADTGSVVVDTTAGRSRAASLLPPVHIALLPVSALYPDLPTWMALQGGGVLADTANLTIISGPSKTADIELNLVLGVHGPGEIHVILLE